MKTGLFPNVNGCRERYKSDIPEHVQHEIWSDLFRRLREGPQDHPNDLDFRGRVHVQISIREMEEVNLPNGIEEWLEMLPVDDEGRCPMTVSIELE